MRLRVKSLRLRIIKKPILYIQVAGGAGLGVLEAEAALRNIRLAWM